MASQRTRGEHQAKDPGEKKDCRGRGLQREGMSTKGAEPGKASHGGGGASRVKPGGHGWRRYTPLERLVPVISRGTPGSPGHGGYPEAPGVLQYPALGTRARWGYPLQGRPGRPRKARLGQDSSFSNECRQRNDQFRRTTFSHRQ